MTRTMSRVAAVAACAFAIANAEAAPADARGVSRTLTLEGALDSALARHPELAIARASLGVERADSAAAGARAHRPELGVGFERGGEDFGSGDDQTLDVGIAQELEIGGQRGARRALAGARARTADAEVAARAQAIEAGVRSAFRRGLLLQDRLARSTALAELDRKVADAAEARVKDGTLTPFTARMNRLEFVRAEADRRAAARDLAQTRLALAAAMGADLLDDVELEGALGADTLAVTDDDVVATALAARKEAEVLRRRVEERRAAHALAVREGRPNLTLGAGVVFERQELAGLHDEDKLWRVEASLPLPFGQPNRATQARAEAEVALAQAEAAGAEVRFRTTARAAARRFRDAASVYRMHRELSPRVLEDLELVRRAYADGRIPLDTYLTEKGRLADALRFELAAGDEYVAALDALEAAAGVDLERLNAGGRP